MKWGKIVLAAVAATVVNAIYGMLTCGWLFNWVYKLPPTEILRPETGYTGSFWAVFHVGGFIVYLILATIFVLIEKALPSKCRCCAGVAFGLIVWAVGVLPGMFYLYMFTVMAPGLLLYWVINGLVAMLITGLVIAWICGKKPAEGSGCCCTGK